MLVIPARFNKNHPEVVAMGAPVRQQIPGLG